MKSAINSLLLSNGAVWNSVSKRQTASTIVFHDFPNVANATSSNVGPGSWSSTSFDVGDNCCHWGTTDEVISVWWQLQLTTFVWGCTCLWSPFNRKPHDSFHINVPLSQQLQNFIFCHVSVEPSSEIQPRSLSFFRKRVKINFQPLHYFGDLLFGKIISESCALSDISGFGFWSVSCFLFFFFGDFFEFFGFSCFSSF